MKLIMKGQVHNFKRIIRTVQFKRKALERGYVWVYDELNKQDVLVSTDFLVNLDGTPFNV